MSNPRKYEKPGLFIIYFSLERSLRKDVSKASRENQSKNYKIGHTNFLSC